MNSRGEATHRCVAAAQLCGKLREAGITEAMLPVILMRSNGGKDLVEQASCGQAAHRRRRMHIIIIITSFDRVFPDKAEPSSPTAVALGSSVPLASNAHAVQAFNAGANDWVEKPISGKESAQPIVVE